MMLHGHQLIASVRSAQGSDTFHALDPATGERLDPAFFESTFEEVDAAVREAERAGHVLREQDGHSIAALLEGIAAEIEALGDALIERACRETGLPVGRLTGERGRTVGQLRLFAAVAGEGSWVDARIDTARPDRQPVPKPDIRRMLAPIGPVVVFGASNFPLAFSVAGGDTASALAAGCPVVVKGHPAHPGTCEMVGEAISRAVERAGFPPGTFSLLQGSGHDVGLALVSHPLTQAVGFTGSFAGGKALFDAAVRRESPIPVYAEMGSINPVFLLPEALEMKAARIAEAFVQSFTLGVGQFCTNPGLVVAREGEGLTSFLGEAVAHTAAFDPQPMLHPGICAAFGRGVEAMTSISSVRLLAASEQAARTERNEAAARLFVTDAETFLSHPRLAEEVFGPSSLVVACSDGGALERVAESLTGHLTASLHGTEADLRAHRSLVRLLERKVGRLVLNGFPTGVEVSPSMHHGGPYPATTDVHFTSVGTAAMLRWARPICFQGFPEGALPPPLQNANPSGRWRLIDGILSKAGVTG